MSILRGQGGVFGFAAMACRANLATLLSEEFIDRMIARGCTIGYFTEYVPVGPAAEPGWVLADGERERLRNWVLSVRRSRPIALIQFPADEYAFDGRCGSAGNLSVHINSQGCLEPCPFAPYARENVCATSLAESLRSPFLAAIREHPTLLKRECLACSLFEHDAELRAVAERCGARRTG